MTTYHATITDSDSNNPTYGDHVNLTRTVTGLTTSQVISKAWLTVKAQPTDADGSAALQSAITTAGTAAGQITDDGTAATEGTIKFTVTDSDGHYASIEPAFTYHYDIQVLLDDGTVSTLEVGTVRWERQLTTASS